ncbi:MAG: GAF domain-containing protein [Chloroflexota bacterium]|nr:GAF domain-containing protein [Chloroflexota bacterium]MDE3192672.1 GAF domain-containing protein [Chloroflexota bacterium]
MLDDLARAFGCDRGFIGVYDEQRRSLHGVSGHGLRPELVDSMDIRLEGGAALIEEALSTGRPQRVDDIVHDTRLAEPVRQLFLEAGFQRTVLIPVAGPGGGPVGIVALSRRAPFSDREVQGLVAVTNRARDVLASVRDAAEMRDTGEAHAVEKEWLWWMVNAVDDPAVVTDENNEIMLRNVRAELLFRAHDDDSEGRRHAVWMNNFLFTAALSSWKLDPSGRATGREVTLVDPIEGSEIVYEVIARAATNYRDASRGTVAVLKDVTQLRHVNEELERGREQLHSAGEAIRVERDRLELILRSVPNPIVVFGSEDEPITMNAAAIRLFGAESDRPTPVSDRRRRIVLANETRLTSFITQLRLDPGERKTGELALADPETEDPLEMSVAATEIRDGVGAVVGVVAVLQDIGRLRELERRRVEQVLFDSEKLAATGRLAASIAHELNNPLEAIQNSLYVLVEHMTGDDPDRPFLEIARKETGRMSRILREMLGFYRPALEMAPTDVTALIEEAEALLAKRLRDRKVTLEKRIDQHLPTIRASGDQLKQVLLNLFLNAADAMPDGGTVSVTTTLIGGARIGMPTGRSVQIQVRDTGMGIREEDLAHVFEPFFSTKGGRSSGLGLWVSSGIVQAHGGTLQVRSLYGRGTTFTIVLPVDGPPPKEPAS